MCLSDQTLRSQMMSWTPGVRSAFTISVYRVASAVHWNAILLISPVYMAASSPCFSQSATGSSTNTTVSS